MERSWWKEAVIYQVYLRSFQDSNGDGVGDIGGIIQRLDYLQKLGVTVLWLNPCYPSPDVDNGYDISDYCGISPKFGTLDQFDELLRQVHARGMKLIMDLVVNHTSDQHPWFQQSRSSKENPYRDYYIWRKGKNGAPPNNWGSHFTPSVWEYDPATDEYYLHLFAKEQPDLNWENPEVRQQVWKIMRFWLDKGVDGFRMDVINLIKKPEGLPDSPLPATCAEGYTFDCDLYANNPGLTDFYREMKREVLDHYPVMTVGETAKVTPEFALDYVGEPERLLSMVFHFQIVELRDNFTWGGFKAIQRKWVDALWNKGWSSQFLQNHDQPRCVSVYGDDGEYRVQSAKMLGTLLHTLPGTPYVYQGEELGTTNTAFTSIDQYNDINAKFDYQELLAKGKTPEQALAVLNRYSRDHARTPMQWTDGPNAGSTEGQPWLMVNPNYPAVNAEQQENDPDSVLNYYRALIRLRKEHPVMVYGEFQEYEPEREDVYLYTRSLDGERWLIALNLTGRPVEAKRPVKGEYQVLLANYPDPDVQGESLHLRPWEAVICCL